jgi:orotate phosphoribosyltransferase
VTSRSHDAIRARARADLRHHAIVLEGHFDYGNGFHGQVYLNPHQLFCHPSTIWRVAQDLIEILPADLIDGADVVAGPVTGGALLAHTLAGLLDGRRPLTRAPYLFAPFATANGGQPTLSAFYRTIVSGRRVLLADDVRNTGLTLRHCDALIAEAGGTTVGTVVIVDRMEAQISLPVPEIALVDYTAPANYPAESCPLCAAGTPVTTF